MNTLTADITAILFHLVYTQLFFSTYFHILRHKNAAFFSIFKVASKITIEDRIPDVRRCCDVLSV